MATHPGTVILGVYGATDATGWTNITPRYEDVFSSNANNSNIIYVSNSTGSDSNPGTFASPIQTVTTAMNTGSGKGTLGTGVRDGFPDWILFKKGDTFPAEAGTRTIFNSGTSSTEPALFSSYSTTGVTQTTPRGTGTGARPIILDTLFFSSAHGNNIAFVGIEFYNRDRDPNYAGCTFPITFGGSALQYEYPITWALVEDCRVSFYAVGVDISFVDPATGVNPSGLIFRRNIVTHCYSGIVASPASGGMLIYCDNLLIEENVLDHNGWNETLSAVQTATFSGTIPAVLTLPSSIATTGTTTGHRIFFVDNGDTLPAGLSKFVKDNAFAYTVSSVTATTFNIVPPAISFGNAPLGTFTNGSAIVTFSATTSNGSTVFNTTDYMAPGEDVTIYFVNSGTVSFPAGTKISSVDSSTQITLTNTATVTGGGTAYLNFAPTASSFMSIRNAGSGTHKCLCIESYPTGDRNHNFYMQGYGFDAGVSLTPFTVRGNIISRDATGSQFRGSATVSNNLLVANPYNHNIAATRSGVTSAIESNVYLDGVYYTYDPGGVGAQGPATMNTVGWHGSEYNYGTVNYTNNIIANSTVPAMGQPAIKHEPGFTGSVTGNIVYNWGGNNNTDGTGTVQYVTGAIYTFGTITAGSGYTDRAVTITGADGTGGSGRVKITVASGADNLIDTRCVIYGLEANGVDNRVWLVHYLSNTSFELWGSEGLWTGSFSSGTFYYPYYRVSLKKDGASDGTASASASIFVKGGTVVAVDMYSGLFGGVAGNGYVAGGLVVIDATQTTNNGFTTPGAGSGFKVQVATLAPVTISANKLDTAGTNLIYSFPHPNPIAPGSASLVGDYNYYNRSSTSSWTDFLDAAAAQSKDTWDSTLTANVANTQILIWFGASSVGGTGSDLSTTSFGNKYGVYKSRPIKIPHA